MADTELNEHLVAEPTIKTGEHFKISLITEDGCGTNSHMDSLLKEDEDNDSGQ